MVCFLFFKQKTAYEMRISDWSSDVCSSDLPVRSVVSQRKPQERQGTMTEAKDGYGIGARLVRKEDARFLRGRGTYVADVRQPGMMDVAFVRSPVAHELGRASWRGRVGQYV